MNTKLSLAERESIDRVSAVFEAERQAMTGNSLAALWGDLDNAITDLRDNEPVEASA
jgi:hypothetical protein